MILAATQDGNPSGIFTILFLIAGGISMFGGWEDDKPSLVVVGSLMWTLVLLRAWKII